jgi:predicted DNA-binding transcriptional regulator AlpA
MKSAGAIQIFNANAFSDFSDDHYVRQSQLVKNPAWPDIKTVLPFSAPTLWRKVRAGTFPSPVKFSDRVTVWKVGDVRAWMAAQTGGTIEDVKVEKPAIKAPSLVDLRDYFAAKAMEALIIDRERADQSRAECARLAYLMADAMLKERTK